MGYTDEEIWNAEVEGILVKTTKGKKILIKFSKRICEEFLK